MTKPQFAFIPSAYKLQKIYSVLPVDDSGDMTFSRGSEATRVIENGLIENVLSNTPRLNWLNSNCPSLLMEEPRTNLFLNSEDMNSQSKINVSVSTDVTVAPDGLQTADLVTRTQTYNGYINGTVNKAGYNIDTSFSFFVKKNNTDWIAARVEGASGNKIDFNFDFISEDITNVSSSGSGFTIGLNRVHKYNNGWYRIELNFTSDNHTSLSGAMSPRATVGYIGSLDSSPSVASSYFWGVQMEFGACASSYMKTNGGQSSRSRDETNGADLPYNKEQGTLFIDAKAFNNGYQSVISLSDGGGANQITFTFNPNNSLTILINNAFGSPIGTYIYSHAQVRRKYAIKWQGDNYYIYINGLLAISYTNTNRFFSSLTRFNFSSPTLADDFQGEVYNTQIFDVALNNDEIINLTK